MKECYSIIMKGNPIYRVWVWCNTNPFITSMKLRVKPINKQVIIDNSDTTNSILIGNE